jgi:hypothetical protein
MAELPVSARPAHTTLLVWPECAVKLQFLEQACAYSCENNPDEWFAELETGNHFSFGKEISDYRNKAKIALMGIPVYSGLYRNTQSLANMLKSLYLQQ